MTPELIERLRSAAKRCKDTAEGTIRFEPELVLMAQYRLDEAIVALEAPTPREAELEAALTELVNAKALSGVREIVAGWNGENLPEPHKERHPDKLGATLPKTNCAAVYALDDAMVRARLALNPTHGKEPKDGRA